MLVKRTSPVGQASWARWLDTFTNTTGAPITVKVAFGGQTGYSPSGANSSAMVNTSTGDAAVTGADAWAEVATPLSGTTLVGGPQATVIGTPAPFGGAMTFTGNWLHDTFNNPLAYSGHEGNFQAYVNTLTLAPGRDESLLHFVVLGQRVTTATSAAGAPEGRGHRGDARRRAGGRRPDRAELCSIDNFTIRAVLRRRRARSRGSRCPRRPSRVTTSGYDVVEKTIGQMRADMESGLTTSQAITRAYLDRIEVYDQGQFGFNAYEIVAADAMAQARGRRRGARGGQEVARPRHPDRDQEPLRHQGHGDDQRQLHVRRLPADEGRLPGRQAARGRRGDHRQGGAGGVRHQRQLLQRPVGPGLERVQPVEVGARVQRRLGDRGGGEPGRRRARLADRRLAVRARRPAPRWSRCAAPTGSRAAAASCRCPG